MNRINQKTLLLLLCVFAMTRAHAQMGWARSYDISTAIPGATWSDVCKVLKVDQNRHVVAGTLTNGSSVVARFSQDGIAGWVREIQVPGTVEINDIAESRDAANPGYVICGRYITGGLDYNYLARLDDMGNLQWDRIWHFNSRLFALVITASNQIVATGSAISGATSTTAYRFDAAGNSLAAKVISTDPEIIPVDILEDPTFNGTGGFFILANYKNVGSSNKQAFCLFINNSLSFVQSHILTYNPLPPPPQKYTYVEAVCFERDITTKELIILTNARGNLRQFRPSVIKFNPGAIAGTSSVVLNATGIPDWENLEGTALHLIKGSAANGIMVTAVREAASGSPKSYTWRTDNALKTTDFFEQWLSIPNVKNMSLCLAKDNQHYVLAGHDAGNYLTLNVVNLNGNKVDNAGTSKCINAENWIDEHPPIVPNATSYASINLSVNPGSLTTSNPRSWWHEGACWCAEVGAQTAFRYAYPQITYDSWELDINRATRGSNGNLYIVNTLDLPSPDRAYVLELNTWGQNTNTWGSMGPAEKDGRQMIQSRHNGDLIMISRSAMGGGPAKTTIGRFSASGTSTIWGSHFPTAQTPGRLYAAEAWNSTDIVVAGDIDGPDEHANTQNLMIARFSSTGATMYYREIPVLFNGMQRDNFRVLALEPTRDGGFAICGSMGSQNNDFIGGFVMKFNVAGALMWQYEFRRQTPNNCYDLNGPHECRSASMLFDLRQNGPAGFYIAGYTSDHDANGRDASFWNGLVIHLDNFGNELAVQEYNTESGSYTTFKGITVSGSDIGVVGDMADPGMVGRTDLFVRIDKASLGLLAAQTYGHNDNSSLLDIFQGSAAGAGYTMVGSTTDWYGQLTPQTISADINGSNGCETAVGMGEATPVNDPLPLDLDHPVVHNPQQLFDELHPTCVEVFDICEPLTAAAMRPQPTGLNGFGSRQKENNSTEIAVYPNPASTVLNLEVPKDVKVREISIVDINGREVYRSSAFTGNHTEINIAALPEGIYAVRMETSTGQRFTRFMKL